MTTIIPHGDRPLKLFRAVFDIVLRDGVGAINQAAVASEVGTSLASIRRWTPAGRLPRCGLDWILRRRHARRFEPLAGALPEESTAARAANTILRHLPADEERRDEERVWSRLTDAFAHEDWARTEVEYRRRVTALAIAAMLDVDPEDTLTHERLELTTLIHGATTAVRDGVITPSESVDVIRPRLIVLAARAGTPAAGSGLTLVDPQVSG